MNKYEVSYHSYYFGHSTIHVWAKDAEDAEACVKKDGVGSINGKREYPDEIKSVRLIERGREAADGQD